MNVDRAYNNTNKSDYLKYADVRDRLINDVEKEMRINGYVHALRDNDIRHIKNSHSEGTNEKYPVTADGIKLIPYIVENYDMVFPSVTNDGKDGLFYVKVMPNNLAYYFEQMTTKYGNEPLLVNKQMIKTGIDDIPDIKNLKRAINKKQSETEFLADLKQIRQEYAQSVHQFNSANTKISQNESGVNSNSMQEDGNYAGNIRYSLGVANETEGRLETEDEIYNRIGWAYDVLTPEDMHIVQQQIAEAGIQGYDSFCKFTDTDTNQTMLALAANNNIVIVYDDFEFPVIHAVVNVSEMILADTIDILKDAEGFYNAKYRNQKGRSRAPFQKFIQAVQAQVGKTYTLVHERSNYIGTGANGTRQNQGTGTYKYGRTGSQNSGRKPYGRRNSRKNVHVIRAHDNDNGTITVYYSNGE